MCVVDKNPEKSEVTQFKVGDWVKIHYAQLINNGGVTEFIDTFDLKKIKTESSVDEGYFKLSGENIFRCPQKNWEKWIPGEKELCFFHCGRLPGSVGLYNFSFGGFKENSLVCTGIPGTFLYCEPIEAIALLQKGE